MNILQICLKFKDYEMSKCSYNVTLLLMSQKTDKTMLSRGIKTGPLIILASLSTNSFAFTNESVDDNRKPYI